LIGRVHTAVAENATRHVQLYIRTQIVFFKSAAREIVTRACLTMIVAEILEVTLTSLVAYRAIERMIDKQELDNACASIDHFLARDIFNHHAIHHRRAARCHQLRHWAWVGGRTCSDLYEAGAAFTTTALQFAIVAHGGWCNFTTDLACCIQDRCAGWYFDRDVVNCYFEQLRSFFFYFFSHNFYSFLRVLGVLYSFAPLRALRLCVKY
jgi:hypothetical protein